MRASERAAENTPKSNGLFLPLKAATFLTAPLDHPLGDSVLYRHIPDDLLPKVLRARRADHVETLRIAIIVHRIDSLILLHRPTYILEIVLVILSPGPLAAFAYRYTRGLPPLIPDYERALRELRLHIPFDGPAPQCFAFAADHKAPLEWQRRPPRSRTPPTTSHQPERRQLKEPLHSRRPSAASDRHDARAGFQAVEVVGPCLHHPAPLREALRAVVRGADFVALRVSKL